ncbi:S8 family peptidase [Mycoplasma sp. CSL10166]|uniref:S8 family peptidase n=1 Tax=Mycoplasma sp. CSL10166 TaxID=2813825 RepID=UPI00197B8D63|nr:S8 family peptidase [Mycoplasma sp. CSL10166]MBN4084133.1 S8 family peptidase [Mycoplasma sp. CSL10166]
MNEILELKGEFEKSPSSTKPGPSNLPIDEFINISNLKKIYNDLIKTLKFWENEKLKINPLISVHYIKIVAKSNRVKGLFKNSIRDNNNLIVGAKFNDNKTKHIITYCMTLEVLHSSIQKLNEVIKIFEKNFGEEINYSMISEINSGHFKDLFSRTKLRQSTFVNVIVDSYWVDKINVEKEVDDIKEDSIVTIFKTGNKISDIFDQLNISYTNIRKIDETTFLLKTNEYNILKEKAPFLISMSITDISKIDIKLYLNDIKNNSSINIPDPKDEPVVGVIDTMFHEDVYFNKWVEFKNMLDPNIELESKDYIHGTAVSSIIVDGPTFNPQLEDGCGRFRVKHFGVSTASKFSSYSVLKSIKEIVLSNKDIKVWNLSLGSYLEINNNFISPEAAFLDKLQYENDIIFIIAGTNKLNKNINKIGSPADSINSLVVNSVNFNNEPTDYARSGPVLSFYQKPDVSYYGGTDKQPIRTCTHLGEKLVAGTSFSAPWITRKIAYLIHIMKFSREVAKALIIDSAVGWKNKTNFKVGYGVVPIHINKIINTPKDEIKFIFYQIADMYESYANNIIVPIDKGKHPFISKAVLCYFPNSSKNQGVDYTNTELDIHFGRIKDKKGNVLTINDNNQNNDHHYTYEESARDFYRKWDNVKVIIENIKTQKGRQKKSKRTFVNQNWGIKIRKKERVLTKSSKIKFGVVVTLKEINGNNRIYEFIKMNQLSGWIVNKIDVKNKIDVYEKSNEIIEFD